MRIKGVFTSADYPGDPAEVAELFATLMPGVVDPAFDLSHSGMAFAAHVPQLALQLGQLSRFLALDASWSQRADLRELAIQTVNLRFNSAFSFEARLPAARAAGLSRDQLAALSAWRTSGLFDADQLLTIEYAGAVTRGDVPAPLFARVVERWGERGAVECTAVIGLWSMWAMMLNAAGAILSDQPKRSATNRLDRRERIEYKMAASA